MLFDRMIRAARLDVSLYEEVERDRDATTQAFLVVVIVSLATGISNFLGLTLTGHPGQAVSGLIAGILGSVLGWILWSLVTYWIGTAVFHGTATPGELLRTIGFASSPRVFQFFSFIPCIGPLISLVVALWALVAGVIAVRQALDFDTSKAILTALLGWLAMVAISLVLVTFRLAPALF